MEKNWRRQKYRKRALILDFIAFKVKIKVILTGLKGHSLLWYRADLDTSFLTLKKVHLNLKSKYF